MTINIVSLQDHNLVQSNYSFKQKKYTNKYSAREQLESVIVLRTNATLRDWATARDLDHRGKLEGKAVASKFIRPVPKPSSEEPLAPTPPAGISAYMSKSLVTKIPTTMTIINSNSAVSNALQVANAGVMSNSTQSDDVNVAEEAINTQEGIKTTRLIYNKALEAVQGTGHCRGFIKKIYTLEGNPSAVPIFGVFCIRWRRANCKEENESKFVIRGLDIAEPPLNIYCTIEEKMFVKMPMAFKVVLKNPTTHVLHLIANLSISKTDNFICSGHKQVRPFYSTFCLSQVKQFIVPAGHFHNGLRGKGTGLQPVSAASGLARVASAESGVQYQGRSAEERQPECLARRIGAACTAQTSLCAGKCSLECLDYLRF